MNNDINEELIKDYIKTRGLTKVEFCKLCGFSVSTLNRILAGEDCEMISIFRMARTMGIAVHLLFKRP